MEEVTEAMLKDRYGPKVRPIAYVCHVPRLTALAREYGYAIAIHGSLQRDLDLVAVPWSGVAVDALTLVKAVCEIVGGFILEGQWEPEKKPHGRLAWTIHLGAGLWIDLSVMPRSSEAGGGGVEPGDENGSSIKTQQPDVRKSGAVEFGSSAGSESGPPIPAPRRTKD